MPCSGCSSLHEVNPNLKKRRKKSDIVTDRKKLEKVVFLEEVFLHKKISNKDVYVDYDTMVDIPEDAVKQYGDLTTLK